ncbi:MAG: hypothetical protein QOH06_718 [Acidobacteriota bacterium]|jgi:hypothetical protein|nr:hypothetical protein [Acidobacteriota bacterium]
MEDKATLFRSSMDEAELDRLAFLVYKKTMTMIGYTGVALSLGLGLFGFFGFNKWKDISAKLEALETSISDVKRNTSVAQNELSTLSIKSNQVSTDLAKHDGVIRDALIETGRMMQVKEDAAVLKARIVQEVDSTLRGLGAAQKGNDEKLDTRLAALQIELQDSAKARKEASIDSTTFQQRIERTAGDLKKQVEQSHYAGFTVLVLQDKHTTAVSANKAPIKISFGDAKDGLVHNVVIDFGAANENRSFLKQDEPVSFSRLDPDKVWRTYSFRILDINMLAFRDLVTCELSWVKMSSEVARAEG